MNKGEVPPASEWGGHRRGGGGGGQGPLGLQAGALSPDHTGELPPGPAALLKRPAQEDPKPHCWGTLLRTLWAPALPGPGSFREAPPSWARGPAPTHLFLVASRFRSPLRRSPALTLTAHRGSPPASELAFSRRLLSLTGAAALGVTPFLGAPQSMSGRTVHNVQCVQMTRLARAGGISQTPNQGLAATPVPTAA